jgi:hypothetical protein
MIGVDADDFVSLASGGGSYGSGVVVTMVNPVAIGDVEIGSSSSAQLVTASVDIPFLPQLAVGA